LERMNWAAASLFQPTLTLGTYVHYSSNLAGFFKFCNLFLIDPLQVTNGHRTLRRVARTERHGGRYKPHPVPLGDKQISTVGPRPTIGRAWFPSGNSPKGAHKLPSEHCPTA